MCLLFILACLLVSRQSCSPVLMIALPPGTPPCSSLQHQGRDLDVRWWGRERTFWFSSFQFYLGSCPKSSLTVTRKVIVWATCHLPCPYLLTSLAHLLSCSYKGLYCRWHGPNSSASLRISLRGVVLGRCLQIPSQEVPRKRRSCFHLSSYLLLAFFSGISYSPKRDGNLAGWKDLIVLLHPSVSPPSQDFCTVQVTLPRRVCSFLSWCWCERGWEPWSFPGDGWCPGR